MCCFRFWPFCNVAVARVSNGFARQVFALEAPSDRVRKEWLQGLALLLTYFGKGIEKNEIPSPRAVSPAPTVTAPATTTTTAPAQPVAVEMAQIKPTPAPQPAQPTPAPQPAATVQVQATVQAPVPAVLPIIPIQPLPAASPAPVAVVAAPVEGKSDAPALKYGVETFVKVLFSAFVGVP